MPARFCYIGREYLPKSLIFVHCVVKFATNCGKICDNQLYKCIKFFIMIADDKFVNHRMS